MHWLMCCCFETKKKKKTSNEAEVVKRECVESGVWFSIISLGDAVSTADPVLVHQLLNKTKKKREY